MLARPSCEAELGLELLYTNLLESDSLLKIAVPDCEILPRAEQASTANNDKAVSKKKGRPKGEKNGPERERKQKTLIEEGDRRKGHWSVEENKRYHWFLEIYNRHFICKEMRRLDKIFKTMALFIGSREAEQCRSHHQKMQKKYSSFLNIILFLRRNHYGQEDESRVLADMQANNIKENLSFVNVEELQEQQANKAVPPTPSMIEDSKANLEICSPIREVVFQQDILDFMGEHYEHMLDFGHMF